MTHIGIAEAATLAARAFGKAGVPGPQAQDAARILAMTEAMGIRTHGLARVAQYIDRIDKGGVDPAASITCEQVAPTICRVDGAGGLGPAIAETARRAAMDAARSLGLGAAFIRRGSHVGALAPYLHAAAEAGFACIFLTSTAPMIAPAGGRAARVGNMPVGIGVPHPEGRHMILDLALSTVARSRIRAAAAEGREIPPDWGTDAEGRPTTDPKAALSGLLRAIGGDKGAVLAVGLDVFIATLSGAAMLSEIPDAVARPEMAPGIGNVMILIDAARLGAPGDLGARLDDAATILAGTPAIDPGNPPRLPGAGALSRLATARAEGLSLAPGLLDELRQLADRKPGG